MKILFVLQWNSFGGFLLMMLKLFIVILIILVVSIIVIIIIIITIIIIIILSFFFFSTVFSNFIFVILLNSFVSSCFHLIILINFLLISNWTSKTCFSSSPHNFCPFFHRPIWYKSPTIQSSIIFLFMIKHIHGEIIGGKLHC